MEIAYITNQYEWVKESRAVLLAYCKTITPEDFVRTNSNFGRGSISNLLAHMANTYKFWLGEHAFKREMKYSEYPSELLVTEIEALFEEVDRLVSDFITSFQNNLLQEVSFTIDGRLGSTTVFRLFTHVITHEFHHKGQVLSLSRHLGYIPADTDIMR